MGACDSDNRRNLKKNTPNQYEKIYLDCKEYRDKLSNYLNALEEKEKKTREKAKDLLRKKQKDRARLYLRKCKIYKEQIKIVSGKLDMMEEHILTIENTFNTKECLNALKEGNEALQRVKKEINIEDLEKAKEDLEDLKEKDKELGDYFKEQALENEAECEEELNQLTKEIQNDENKLNLPKAPNNKLNDNKVTIQNNNNNNNITNNNKNKIIAV